MAQHVWKDEVPDLRPTEVDLLQVCDLAVPSSDCDALKHGIHVIFTVHEVATIHLACLQLTSDCVPDALVQKFHRDT